MPRPKQSTVRVQRDSYQGKGETHAPRWRVFVHYRSPAGELTRKSFLAPRGSSEATAKAAGDRMLGEMQAADRQAFELARRPRVDTHADPMLRPSPVAAFLGVRHDTVLRWIRDQQLPAIRLGGTGRGGPTACGAACSATTGTARDAGPIGTPW